MIYNYRNKKDKSRVKPFHKNIAVKWNLQMDILSAGKPRHLYLGASLRKNQKNRHSHLQGVPRKSRTPIQIILLTN